MQSKHLEALKLCQPGNCVLDGLLPLQTKFVFPACQIKDKTASLFVVVAASNTAEQFSGFP